MTEVCYNPLEKSHQEFFNKAIPYYVQDNKLFVHGGFDARHGKTPDQCSIEFLTWDRDLIEYAREGNIIPVYDMVYVGHSTTQSYSWELEPIRFSNLIMMDCGAGWTGKLAIMNIDTNEHWLSAIQDPAIEKPDMKKIYKKLGGN
jgi:serine/threonine protein phosphatase 1